MNRFGSVSFDWNDAVVAKLRRLWASGETATLIAEALGPGVTRNAVLGKIHRLGLSKPGQRRNPPSKMNEYKIPLSERGPKRQERPKKMQASKATSAQLAKTFPIPAVPRPEPVVAAIVLPFCEPVAFLDLEPHMCRWPIGDDPRSEDFRFCGATKRENGSYCAHHHRLAYSYSKSA